MEPQPNHSGANEVMVGSLAALFCAAAGTALGGPPGLLIGGVLGWWQGAKNADKIVGGSPLDLEA